MRFIITLLVLTFSTLAYGADKAVILNDQEQAAMTTILDAATKAEGLKIAPMTVYMANKIANAPVVTATHTDSTKTEVPADAAPKEPPK